MSRSWWTDRRVFVTGHTGFMGGWLCSYLLAHGARVSGFALAPPTTPSFFEAVDLGSRLESSTIGDIRDLGLLQQAMASANPEVVFHLAAQPLVRTAYAEPVGTFSTNVMGTVNAMEAARDLADLSALLIVTTDKVYQNRQWHWPYRENDPLGGKEPYSASKTASEAVISAYHHSYFPRTGVAALRVGNIIGGGDWAADRLVPDAVRGFVKDQPLVLRNPRATRPWQHVLDPLHGYLKLAQALHDDHEAFSGGWNFGPAQRDCQPVETMARTLSNAWGDGAKIEIQESSEIFEEKLLSLDSAKAQAELGWQPRWNLQDAIGHTAHWYHAYYNGQDMWELTQSQIGILDQSGGRHAG
ncbi:CDP-glucose 4,6-dehydratase [Aliiroseovarius sp. KMU-50]|uniref:CDP-glucose 4,6-dehydratase n=1 Tax=Aliiroseovarius salicola TaxID=3009082 RepID=A0ABT4W5D6_9RHOB|nr:CDP-glucose 4,6-dehydratase [Aliiroseovarius sp. KMU-50]MDA5095737.1 CDP-glucose 4,6-dehydratase [Aliiroseovarius sp. KMU-50]